jgi:hypothetical protein
MKKKEVEKIVKKEWKNILFNVLFASLVFIVIILTYKNIILTSILVASLSLIALFKWKSKITFLVFLFGSLWGTFSEMIAVTFGVWNYTLPSFYNVPLWLFLVWGDATSFLYQTGVEIKRLGVKR